MSVMQIVAGLQVQTASLERPPEAFRERRDPDVTAGQGARPTWDSRPPHHVCSCLTNMSLESSHTHLAHSLLVKHLPASTQFFRSISLDSFQSCAQTH